MNIQAALASRFKLFIAGMPVAGYPTAADLRDRLQRMYDPKDDFVLMKGPGHYLQCSGTPETGFKVLYREGDANRYFRAAERLVPLQTTAELFVSYLEQDNRWRELVPWRACSGAQGEEDDADSTKRAFSLWYREGDRVILNKKLCLITLGTLICMGAAGSFFMLKDMMDLYLTIIPGSLLAAGVIVLMISNFVDD